MKWIMLLATILLPWKRGNSQVADSVPAALLLANGKCWLATSEVPLRATNCGPGGWRDGYASGGRLQAAFRFLPNNRFSLTISLQMSGYSGETVSVTEVEGEALVGANGKQAILQTRATAGVYRVTRDGNTSLRDIPAGELTNRFSTTYFWQRYQMQGECENAYLFLVDLQKHPLVDPQRPETVDPTWISRFHLSNDPQHSDR